MRRAGDRGHGRRCAGRPTGRPSATVDLVAGVVREHHRVEVRRVARSFLPSTDVITSPSPSPASSAGEPESRRRPPSAPDWSAGVAGRPAAMSAHPHAEDARARRRARCRCRARSRIWRDDLTAPCRSGSRRPSCCSCLAEEAVALRGRGVHADDVAVGVDERAAGVAGLDRRRDLDHAVQRLGVAAAAVAGGHLLVERGDRADVDGRGAAPAAGVADRDDGVADLRPSTGRRARRS